MAGSDDDITISELFKIFSQSVLLEGRFSLNSIMLRFIDKPHTFKIRCKLISVYYLHL
jgi:hypothetical protein